jgi:hypothetical protein
VTRNPITQSPITTPGFGQLWKAASALAHNSRSDRMRHERRRRLYLRPATAQARAHGEARVRRKKNGRRRSPSDACTPRLHPLDFLLPMSTRASPSRDGLFVPKTVVESRPSTSHTFFCASVKLDSA